MTFGGLVDAVLVQCKSVQINTTPSPSLRSPRPAKDTYLGTGPRVPYAHCLVLRRADDTQSVGRDCNTVHRPFMPTQNGSLDGALDLPQAHAPIGRAADHAAAIAGQRDAAYGACMPLQNRIQRRGEWNPAGALAAKPWPVVWALLPRLLHPPFHQLKKLRP